MFTALNPLDKLQDKKKKRMGNRDFKGDFC